MPFREKSAWITASALIVVYGGYFTVLFRHWAPDTAAPLSVALLVAAVIALTMIMAASHIALAVATPKAAAAPADERERLIGLKAESLASYLLSAAVVCVIGALLLGWSAALVANLLLAALVAAELAKAIAQIALFRRGA